MPFIELDQLRFGLVADTGHEVRAAGVKGASLQLLIGAGNHAFDGVELLALVLQDIFEARD